MNYDEIVTDIQTRAGKTTSAAHKTAEGAVDGVIDYINMMLSSEVLLGRATFAVAANTHIIDLPKRAKTIVEMGQYDTTTERILVTWTPMSEKRFHSLYEYADGINSTDEDAGREYAIVDYGQDNLRIRLIPPVLTSVTGLCRYYEPLDKDGVHRVSWSMVRDGAIADLPGWFPNSAPSHSRKFQEMMAATKKKHAHVVRIFRVNSSRSVRQRNLAARRWV